MIHSAGDIQKENGRKRTLITPVFCIVLKGVNRLQIRAVCHRRLMSIIK